MSDQNNDNLLYFENESIQELYKSLEKWQKINKKRFLSINIQKDQGVFCCIALINPMEVQICNGGNSYQAGVYNGQLQVKSSNNSY